MHMNQPILFLADAAATQQGPPAWTSFVPLILLVVVFYFLLIRPQQKKAKEHAELLKTIKRGDRVATSGGLVGFVENVKDRTVVIKSDASKLEILKSAVSEITERGGQSSES
jgi:preprotein translocase subunit YajC